MWLTILSDQLPVVGLVGHYPTNYLIGREHLLAPLARSFLMGCPIKTLARITRDFSQLSGT